MLKSFTIFTCNVIWLNLIIVNLKQDLLSSTQNNMINCLKRKNREGNGIRLQEDGEWRVFFPLIWIFFFFSLGQALMGWLKAEALTSRDIEGSGEGWSPWAWVSQHRNRLENLLLFSVLGFVLIQLYNLIFIILGCVWIRFLFSKNHFFHWKNHC